MLFILYIAIYRERISQQARMRFALHQYGQSILKFYWHSGRFDAGTNGCLQLSTYDKEILLLQSAYPIYYIFK